MLNFGRDAKGKLQEDSSFYTIFYGDKAILLEDELNESQWNQIERLASMNRSQYSSGILNDFTVKSTGEDDVFYIETEQPLSVLINGYDLKIGHNTIDNQPVTISSEDNKIIFKLPHETTGFDFVFLEAWFEVMSHDETIRKYGGEATPAIGNFMLDGRVSRETTKRIQFRWRIRSVRNEENLDNVLAHNYDGVETIAKFNNQNDVFVADIGVQRDKKNNVKSLGKIYALPLFKVTRSGYTIDTTKIKDIVAKARTKAKMQHIKELEQNLPQLDVAEFGFSTDTEKTYIGGSNGNIELAKQSDVTDLKNNLENYFLNIDGQKATIQHKRDIEVNLPQLAQAEFGFATDTETVFIGSTNGNIEMAKQSDVTDLKNNLESYFVQIDGSSVTITHKQELEQNMPQLEPSEIGFAPDTESIFIGGTSGNIEIAKQSDIDDLRTYKADKVYVDTEIGRRIMLRHIDTFIATDGQTLFNLTHSYNPFQNRLDVEVGGVQQYTPDNFIETSTTSFTLVDGAPGGITVVAIYYGEAQPLGTDLEKVVNGLINTKVDKNKLMIRHRDEFIATEGQKVFNLSNSYELLQNRLDVEVDGVEQDSPSNFEETSTTSFTLSEGVPAGTLVIANYFNAAHQLGTNIDMLVNNHTIILTEQGNQLIDANNEIIELQNDKAEKVYVEDIKTDLSVHVLTDASVAQKGHVKLVDSYESNSVIDAVTPNALRLVNEAAKSHILGPDHMLSDGGFLTGAINFNDPSLFNKIYQVGFINMGNSSNPPPESYGILMTHHPLSSDYTKQTFTVMSNGVIYTRTSANALWTPWKKVLDDSMRNVAGGFAGLDAGGNLPINLGVETYKLLYSIDFTNNPRVSIDVSNLGGYKKLRVIGKKIKSIDINPRNIHLNINNIPYNGTNAYSGTTVVNGNFIASVGIIPGISVGGSNINQNNTAEFIVDLESELNIAPRFRGSSQAIGYTGSTQGVYQSLGAFVYDGLNPQPITSVSLLLYLSVGAERFTSGTFEVWGVPR